MSQSTAGTIRVASGDEIFVRVVHDEGANGVPLLLNDGLGCDGYVWKHLIDWLREFLP